MICLVPLVRLSLINSGRELLYDIFPGGSVSCLLLSARGIHSWANPRQASSLPGKPSLVKYGRYTSDSSLSPVIVLLYLLYYHTMVHILEVFFIKICTLNVSVSDPDSDIMLNPVPVSSLLLNTDPIRIRIPTKRYFDKIWTKTVLKLLQRTFRHFKHEIS